MLCNKFDAILFGNGMTINLIQQIKPYVKKEKLYLFDIDEFLKRFMSNNISPREEKRIFKIFYGKKSLDNLNNFEKLKYKLSRFYSNNNSNIEKILGRDIFAGADYNIGLIKSLFPALYNIWFDELYNYITYSGLDEHIEFFYNSVSSILLNNDNIYTTNFDYLADSYINIKHIHGKFIKNLSKYADIYLCPKNEHEFYFKCVWGWNGIGKLSTIDELRKFNNINKYFDFSFFYENVKIDNLLLYGLGFQRSGYMTEEFLRKYPKRRKEQLEGTIVDEHVIIRIKGLQNLKQLKNVFISYYSEEEKEYFQLLGEYYGIKNFQLIHANEFNFSIEG
ncbi:hypothetical protein [Clostridium aciditolerans]|uniref:Uncharacterized protein n=1 Tax=Clostridium aciditolerans TaxID=339861 RepID=A0A934I630_9CLOT|nr:hypothetical protein [Clostridium aciditolerans]MBI6875621.1 hypothetical protein [Clostridium aciditolerans]